MAYRKSNMTLETFKHDGMLVRLVVSSKVRLYSENLLEAPAGLRLALAVQSFRLSCDSSNLVLTVDC